MGYISLMKTSTSLSFLQCHRKLQAKRSFRESFNYVMNAVKFSTAILFLALCIYCTEGQEKRKCTRVATGFQLFDRECRRRTEYKMKEDNDQFRIDCRCVGLFVRECVKCKYQDATTTTTEAVTDGPSTEAPTDAPSTTGAAETTTAAGSTTGAVETTTSAVSSTGGSTTASDSLISTSGPTQPPATTDVSTSTV